MAQNSQESKVVKGESYYAISGAAVLNISNILGELPCRHINTVERIISLLNTVQELPPLPTQAEEVPEQLADETPMRV